MRYGKIVTLVILALALACAAASAQQGDMPQNKAKSGDALPANVGEAAQAVESTKAAIAQPMTKPPATSTR